MRLRYFAAGFVAALSMVLVGAAASSNLSAQAPIPTPDRPLITEGTVILSGGDIGFRVERTQEGVPVGTLVVRVGGRWVAPATREAPLR
jgi:hypothetical protein